MDLAEQKRVMVAYLCLKVQEEDWHGVADAAMDLRELEIHLRTPTPKRGRRRES